MDSAGWILKFLFSLGGGFTKGWTTSKQARIYNSMKWALWEIPPDSDPESSDSQGASDIIPKQIDCWNHHVVNFGIPSRCGCPHTGISIYTYTSTYPPAHLRTYRTKIGECFAPHPPYACQKEVLQVSRVRLFICASLTYSEALMT